MEKALDVGRNFVQSLQRAAVEEVSLTKSQLRELQTLHDQINVILEQLTMHAQEDV
jgi:hypothetical protein